MLRKLRLAAATICLSVYPGVIYASVPIGSQFSSDRSLEDVRSELVGELVRQQFCALGIPERGAVALADAVSDSGMIDAFDRVIRDHPGTVGVQELMQDPAVQDAMQLCAATLAEEVEVTETLSPEWDGKKSRPKVVGVNTPGIVLLILPVVVIVAVMAAAGGSAGSLVAVGLVAGILLVLFAGPEIIFGER